MMGGSHKSDNSEFMRISQQDMNELMRLRETVNRVGSSSRTPDVSKKTMLKGKTLGEIQQIVSSQEAEFQQNLRDDSDERD